MKTTHHLLRLLLLPGQHATQRVGERLKPGPLIDGLLLVDGLAGDTALEVQLIADPFHPHIGIRHLGVMPGGGDALCAVDTAEGLLALALGDNHRCPILGGIGLPGEEEAGITGLLAIAQHRRGGRGDGGHQQQSQAKGEDGTDR